MVHREGILVSWNHHVNAAAVGADIEKDEISFRIYKPADTAKNLEHNSRFTYSLTDTPELFYKAALTGADSSSGELDSEEIKEEDGFYYPVKATQTYFCKVTRITNDTVTDEYGTSDIRYIKAEILYHKGKGSYIQRKNPLVDAMVHASRYRIANDEAMKERIRRKVTEILKDEKGELADKIRKKVGVSQ